MFAVRAIQDTFQEIKNSNENDEVKIHRMEGLLMFCNKYYGTQVSPLEGTKLSQQVSLINSAIIHYKSKQVTK